MLCCDMIRYDAVWYIYTYAYTYSWIYSYFIFRRVHSSCQDWTRGCAREPDPLPCPIHVLRIHATKNPGSVIGALPFV